MSYIFIFLHLGNKDLVKQMIPKEICLTSKMSIPCTFRSTYWIYCTNNMHRFKHIWIL